MGFEATVVVSINISMTSSLTRFADVVTLSSTRTANPLAAGIERFVGLEHIKPENLHIRSWGNVADGTTFTSTFKSGQVLFGKRRAYQRKVAVANFDGVCSSDIYVFESKDPNVLHPELLPFICQSERFYQYAIKTSAGSLSPRTNWTHLANYEFQLPPIDEQRRIADLLWAADDVVSKWQATLESLEKLKNAASIKLFNANDELEWIPCDSLCKEITVGIVVTPAKYYVPNGIPALRSLNIFPDKFVLDELVYISKEANEMHSKSRLSKGDVVIIRTGRPGDAAVINSELDGCNCIDLIIARPGERMSPSYLSRFINSAAGRRKITQGTAGTAQLHFNVSQMKKMPIPLVSLERQMEIVEQLDAIDEQIQQIANQIALSRRLKTQLSAHFLQS
jgi:type I restriction enzyme S subunit